MVGDGAAIIQLSDKNLAEIPKEVLMKCQSVNVLDLSRNPGIHLHGVLCRFNNVRQLVLNQCALLALPNDIFDMTQLEELTLWGNDFSEGLNTTIWRLRCLKKLILNDCKLKSVPDSLGDLEMLEELSLNENDFSEGLNPTIGRLRRLKKLHLYWCKIKSVPDSIGDLEKLEELSLNENDFSEGVNPKIGRLLCLKKLDLDRCKLKSVPDSLGDLEKLEELSLYKNDFSEGLNPTIGRLRCLKKLHLYRCKLKSVPDSLGDLEMLEELSVYKNDFSEGLNPKIGRLHCLKKLHLYRCKLKSVPDSLGDLEMLEELTLWGNDFSEGLNTTIWRLGCLKKLNLNDCKLKSVPDSLGDLEMLEELSLNENHFSEGLNPNIGRLRSLKKLHLYWCKLQSVPDSLGDLEMLEELSLNENDFSEGLNPKIGRLPCLKKLLLYRCKLKRVPDSLGDLEVLEELSLNENDFSEGLNPKIWRLRCLKKLHLYRCKLKSVPDSLGDFERLEELSLNENDFSEGLNPKIGRLRCLRKLDLDRCSLKSVPDNLGDLEMLRYLTLSNNNFEKIPHCLHNMKNLEVVDVSNSWLMLTGNESKGNCIKQLPVELAFTRLRELNLDGNPITEPPKAIWTQGLDSIKSYLRALIPGGALMRADTINLIGDTGAGKTSTAESLIARAPRTAAACDRTRVMQQLQMTFDETSGQSVNINDFGGHEIYHSVMPIFLPANGLLILVLDLTNQMLLQSAKNWLLTAIAKTREIRILIAGTHADKLANIRERSSLEEQIVADASNLLDTAIKEVSAHISHIESRPNDINTQNKLKALCQLLSNLRGAIIRVVTLSCLVPDEGLPRLRDLAIELLLPSATIPIHWCRVINEIRKLSERFYITMSHVQNIAKDHFTEEDDHNALTTILRYLTKTSLIIWVEDHPRLQNMVFHLPQKIIDICKEILHHDSQTFPTHFRDKWDEYENGIVHEPLLRELLKMHTASLGHNPEQIAATALPFEVAVDFLQQFNLISYVATSSGCRRFVIPSKLTAGVPSEFKEFDLMAEKCLNRVSVRLTFIGSIVPMSYFETCLSAMLTVAGQFVHSVVLPWRNGLIVAHGGVRFLAILCDDSITLTAFSEPPVASPWTVLQPMARCLNENAVIWSGAPPSCTVECPWCIRRCQYEGHKKEAGKIDTDLQTLAKLEQPNDAGPTCPKCWKLIPRSLCFPQTSHGSFTEDKKEIQKLVPSRECCELGEKLRKNMSKLSSGLSGPTVLTIGVHLRAASTSNGEQLITQHEFETIMSKYTAYEKAVELLNTVYRHGDPAIEQLISSLRSEEVGRGSLADLLQKPSAPSGHGHADPASHQ